MTGNYGADLVEHFLLSELRAEGHITQVGRDWMYRAGENHYQITVRAKRVKVKKRLEE